MNTNDFKTKIEELDKKILESSRKYNELTQEREKLVLEFKNCDNLKYKLGQFYNFTHKYTKNGMTHEIKGVVQITCIYFKQDCAIIGIKNHNRFFVLLDYYPDTDKFKLHCENETIELNPVINE